MHKKLFNFEIQKCGQILCAHFLMPGYKLFDLPKFVLIQYRARDVVNCMYASTACLPLDICNYVQKQDIIKSGHHYN